MPSEYICKVLFCNSSGRSNEYVERLHGSEVGRLTRHQPANLLWTSEKWIQLQAYTAEKNSSKFDDDHLLK